MSEFAVRIRGHGKRPRVGTEALLAIDDELVQDTRSFERSDQLFVWQRQELRKRVARFPGFGGPIGLLFRVARAGIATVERIDVPCR